MTSRQPIVCHASQAKKNVATKIQLISCTMRKEIDETDVKTQNTFSGQFKHTLHNIIWPRSIITATKL